MNGLTMALQLILGLSILVLLHELGHFLAARAFGIKVEKFYLFFDAWNIKLFRIKKGDTEYGIGWLPLGGYVKISGMIDESMDKEQLKKPPQPWEFRSKPAWQRLIVMIGGVTMNVILGIIIFWILTFKQGETYLPISEVKYGIVAHELGQEVGLQTGDKIMAVNNKPVERFEDIFSTKVLFGNSTLTVNRNGEIKEIYIPADFIDKLSSGEKLASFLDKRQTFYVGDVLPQSNADKAGLKANDKIIAVDSAKISFFDEFANSIKGNRGKVVTLSVIRDNALIKMPVQVGEDGRIGFSPATKDFTYKTIYHDFFKSFVIGNKQAWNLVKDQAKGLGKIVRGEVSATNSVQGPIGIAQIYGSNWDWIRFWQMTGLLSMALAFMNMLPIPALDGGHVIFLTVESITGRKLSDKFMEKAQLVGMIILLTIMVFAIGNDIWKHILK